MRRFAAVIAMTCAAAWGGCHDHSEPHDHTADHPEGHDHHEAGHGHFEGPVVSITLWSDQFELFGEHPPAVVGQTTSFLLHVTVLDGFSAVTEGGVTIELEGPAALSGTSAAPVRPGIFSVEVAPKTPGTYSGRLRVSGATSGVIEGLKLEVLAKPPGAENEEEDDAGLIEFLKEQQWKVPFGTAFATRGSLVATVEVAGRVQTPPGGTAEVGAPVTGRVVAPRAGLLHPGAQVKKGQTLASLIPAPSSPEDASRASLAVAEAAARSSAAKTALERARRLIADEAISKRELEDAERELRVAEESVRASKRAAALYSGARSGTGQQAWRLAAPISGTVVEVNATVGATVSPGATLFRIVDTSQLWIVARVPEQDAARLRTDRNPSYRVAGLEAWKLIDLGRDEAPDSVVTVGKTVDPVSRTVQVIYALGAPEPSLRVGGLVQLGLPSGKDFEGMVVPRGALIDLQGRAVVYVQVDGEHFEERAVRVGSRAGGHVGISAGLEAGERVVTVGAHLVRLAERASGPQAHGHIH